MPQCRMQLENGRSCGDYLWKCKKCGAAGCSNRNCRNQRFDPGNGMCLSCTQSNAKTSL
jgi:hypothetical protein